VAAKSVRSERRWMRIIGGIRWEGRALSSPEEALNCACGLYLNDPSAWVDDSSTN